MSSMLEIEKQLHAKIESAKKDKRTFSEMLLSHTKSVWFYPTSERVGVKMVIQNYDYAKFELFNPAKYIVTLIFSLATFLVLWYDSSKDSIVSVASIALLVGVFIYLPLMFYYWRSPEFNKLFIISKRGIFFEGFWYEWRNIVTTHIKEIEIEMGDEDVRVIKKLTLGLSDLSLIDIDPFRYRIKESELCQRIQWHLKHSK